MHNQVTILEEYSAETPLNEPRTILTSVKTGPIPSDWNVAEIGSVSHKVTNGFVGTSLTHQTAAPGVLYLQGFNVRPCRLDITQPTYVTEAFHREQRKSQLKPGDVLVVQSGHIGTAALVPEGFDEANCHALIIIDLKRNTIDPGYLVQHLNSPIGQRRMRGLHVGSSMLHINTSELAAYRLPFPTLAEQRKIAKILRTWDEAVEKLKTLQVARGRRFAAVAQRLMAPSRAVGRHIPRSNCSLVSFGEIFTERQDRNVNLGPADVVTVGKHGIRKQLEHFSRSVASKDQSGYWLISPGEFVYDPMSAYYGALGRYQCQRDGIVSPAYRVIRLRPDINPDFMVHLLRSHHIRFLLDARSSQGNKEGKRRLLQRDEFAGIKFNLPPPEVQLDIAQKLAVARRDEELTKLQLDALQRQKHGLMHKLLTGERRVEV